MTDLALTPTDNPAPPERRGRRMLMLALPVVAAGLGGASSYLGYWSPLSLLGLGPAEAAAQAPAVAFVDVPDINVSLPGARPRLLHLALKLETDEAGRARIEHLLPRVSDAFNTFLTGIAPQAFDRRGILEVVRDELTTRARQAVGEDIPVAVLITEFALK